jgi:hypothetical protein
VVLVSGASRLKTPSTEVEVPIVVPITTMDTPGIGWLSAAEVTSPDSVTDCACTTPVDIIQIKRIRNFFISIRLNQQLEIAINSILAFQQENEEC